MKMNRSVLVSSLVGGIILFMMSIISWKTAYWQGVIVQNFENEQEVAEVMRKNAPASGVYVMPSISDSEDTAAKLPLILSGVNLEGKRRLWLVLLGSLAGKVFMAFVGTWLLLHHDTKMSYAKRVGFFVLIGCLLAAGSKFSFLIKGYYPLNFALYSMLAIFLQWFVAGLAMAKIAKHR